MYHTHLTHLIWKDFLQKGMSAIDATAGGGNDTLFIAKLILTKNSGKLFAYDIQKEALEKTEKRLKENLDDFLLKRVHLLHKSHEDLPKNENISLIVYNLGYFPGGNEEITTKFNSTLRSIENAIEIILPKGLITITMYPGHEEGKIEKDAILNFLENINGIQTFHHTPLKRVNSPSLLTLRKT
jgi:hypothetical protein